MERKLQWKWCSSVNVLMCWGDKARGVEERGDMMVNCYLYYCQNN